MARKQYFDKAPKRRSYKLRRGQLFGPYGVGSIYPCPEGESLMLSGLDAYHPAKMKAVQDRRLASYIGVKALYTPPEDDLIPASRFPGWHYCPVCHTMTKRKPGDSSKGKCQNPSCEKVGKQDLVPERFIVVCPEGHVDDLPIMEWVHGGPVNNPDAHIIKRTTMGGSPNLGDIWYRCITCGVKRSLAGITAPGALHNRGYNCCGRQPWLWRNDPNGCKADPHTVMVVQRGGTNVWYPDVVSSIYIPDGKNPAILAYVQENLESLKQFHEMGSLLPAAQLLAAQRGYDPAVIAATFLDLIDDAGNNHSTEGDYRNEEFVTLSSGEVQQSGVFEIELVNSSRYGQKDLRRVVSKMGLVTTLRETRALVGFSRLVPDNSDKTFAARRSVLSSKNLNWTLGVQSRGEGIFIQFDEDAFRCWQCSAKLANRFSLMQRHYDEYCNRRGMDKEILNPAYVAIHTLSHLLILALSRECGYAASSIRERIYCDKFINPDDSHEHMLGLLLYTASDDSEGSLGGLVRAGRPGRFEKIFASALDAARWCSSDPVCIESVGQGPESCNLAACYSCALVPETSCEASNKFLDRGVLVGSLEMPEIGMFSEGRSASTDLSPEKNEKEPVAFIPNFEESYDERSAGFAKACDQAKADTSSAEEASFLEDLAQLGSYLPIEVPLYQVPFIAGDDEYEAALAWEQSKVALFVGDEAVSFAEEFGDFYVSKNAWTLIAANGQVSPEGLASKLAGAQNG